MFNRIVNIKCRKMPHDIVRHDISLSKDLFNIKIYFLLVRLSMIYNTIISNQLKLQVPGRWSRRFARVEHETVVVLVFLDFLERTPA